MLFNALSGMIQKHHRNVHVRVLKHATYGLILVLGSVPEFSLRLQSPFDQKGLFMYVWYFKMNIPYTKVICVHLSYSCICWYQQGTADIAAAQSIYFKFSFLWSPDRRCTVYEVYNETFSTLSSFCFSPTHFIFASLPFLVSFYPSDNRCPSSSRLPPLTILLPVALILLCRLLAG